MIPARWKRAALVLLLVTLATVLTGCWDNKELVELFILTGMSIDVADNPGQITVTAQVANLEGGGISSGSSGSEGGDTVIILQRTGDSLMRAITLINRDSNHRLLLQHNQVRLFGIELAKQGFVQHLDMIMRDQQARLEVPMVVVDGRAEEALTAKLAQEPNSGIYLRGMFDELADTSVKYRVRLLDFVQSILDDAAAPVLPIVRVTGEGDKQEIQLDGMAIFQDGKMTGRLSNDEIMGYIWSFGDVKMCSVEIVDGSNRAVLRISELNCKREITLRQDGGVRVSLTIHSALGIGELYGFEDMKPAELMKHLENLAQEKIENTILDCFAIAQGMNADIFEFCTMMYKKYPKQWAEMKDRWAEVFSDIDLQVRVKASIPATGQIIQSLEMEERMK